MTALFPTSRPSVSVRALVKFPARVVTDGIIRVTVANGVYSFSIDETVLSGLLPGLLPLSAHQLLCAVEASLGGGIFGYDRWLPASMSDANRRAFERASDAISLSAGLLAYMQAPLTDNPPGLAMTLTNAQNALAGLLALAATQPR